MPTPPPVPAAQRYPLAIRDFVTYQNQPGDNNHIVQSSTGPVDLTLDGAVVTRDLHTEIISLEQTIGANPFMVPGNPTIGKSIQWLHSNLSPGHVGPRGSIDPLPPPSHSHVHQQMSGRNGDDHPQYMLVNGSRPFINPVTAPAAQNGHELITLAQAKGAGLTWQQVQSIIQSSLTNAMDGGGRVLQRLHRRKWQRLCRLQRRPVFRTAELHLHEDALPRPEHAGLVQLPVHGGPVDPPGPLQHGGAHPVHRGHRGGPASQRGLHLDRTGDLVGVYGIDFYGVGRFGPDPALVRPDFSVAPFDFLPLDYQSLHLTWKNPVSADCTQLRLVRNGSNLPQDENDGAQVFVLSNYATTNTNDAIVVGAITSLTDVHLAGGFQYYTMFGWSASSQVWVRCTDLIALVPLPWGYGWRMYNLMPMAYRDADIILVDPYNPWSTEGLPGGSPPLQRYLQLVGFQFDFIRTEMESLMSINDVANCSGALLPLMAQQLGLVHEPEVGMQQERQLVQNAVHLYKQKGSPRGITEMASILTSYPATQLVHHGYNELLCLDDGVMADAIGTWQVWPPRIPTDPITWNANPGGYTGTYTNVFAPLAGQAAGEALTWIPNLLSGSIANMTNPLETFGTPSTWPSSIQPPYQNSGMRVQGTGAGDYNLTTSGIPITDFLSQYGGPGNITWRIQVWSATARTVWLSVWGDVGSGTRVQVLPEQSFVETAGHWTTMTITGTMNPYPNSLPGASAPTGPASYYRLFPQIRIAGAAANEAHYVTICGLWPCTPAQIGIDTPTYDYPRDIKLLLQPQASNLLTNTVSTFSKINPSPPPSLLGIGFDGLTNTVDPNQPPP